MLLNVTQSRLVIGRFTILPGEKVPAFALTDTEAKAVQDFLNRGFLAEKDLPRQATPSKKGRETNRNTSKTDTKIESLPDGTDKTAPFAESSGENKDE